MTPGSVHLLNYNLHLIARTSSYEVYNLDETTPAQLQFLIDMVNEMKNNAPHTTEFQFDFQFILQDRSPPFELHCVSSQALEVCPCWEQDLWQ